MSGSTAPPGAMEPSAKGSLRQRVLDAGAWTVGGHFMAQIIRLGSSLLMTRLLVPELFGIMALALTFLMAMAMFSDFGLRQVVVQHRDEASPEFLNTVWVVQIVRGGFICTGGLLIAALLPVLARAGWLPPASTYAHPDLPTALAMVSLTALASGAESTKSLVASRQLALRRLTMIELASQLAGLAVMFAWASSSPTVFAASSGAVVAAFGRAVLTHVAIPGMGNRLRWSAACFEEIYRFSRWIFVTSILGFLIASGDKILLGALLDARLMGVYTIATLIVASVTGVAHKLTNAVMFPALSEVYRRDPGTMRNVYYRFRLPIDLASGAIAGILLMAGPAIIGLLYDPRYAGAGVLLQWLGLTILLTGVNSAGQAYMAAGKPSLVTALIAVRLVGLYASTPLLVQHFGLLGGAWGVLVGHAVTVPAMYYYKVKQGIFVWWRELLCLPGLAVGLLAGWLLVGAIAAIERAWQ